MEFTFEDKLNFVFGAPISGPCLLEAEAAAAEDDAQLDRRRASTTHYKQHRDAILELERMRDRAKVVGLDAEFRKIVRSIVPGGIKSGDDLTRQNVFNIALALVNKQTGESSLRGEIEKRERKMGAEVDDVGDSELINAVNLLRNSAPSEAPVHATPSFKNLINSNYENDPEKPLTIYYSTGPDHKRAQLVFDNSRSIYPQYKDFINAANQSAKYVPADMRDDYAKLIKSLTPLHDARATIIKSHMPSTPDTQVQYMAAFYTLRNVAIDFERLEIERKRKYNAGKTRAQSMDKSAARAAAKAAKAEGDDEDIIDLEMWDDEEEGSKTGAAQAKTAADISGQLGKILLLPPKT